MTGTQKIAERYSKILAQEDATRKELAASTARLDTVEAEDIAAGAFAALADQPLPARKAIKVKHAVENLTVDLLRLDEAVYRLQLEARAEVGEGRDFPVFIPPNALASRAEVVAEWKAAKVKGGTETEEEFEARIERMIPRGHVDAESIVREAHRQRELSLDRRLPRLTERPDDLIAWIESAYEAEDRAAESTYEFLAKKQRGHDAIEAVNRAKMEHKRRGLPAGSFNMRSYSGIILPEHLEEFEEPVARSPFEKAREHRLPSHQPEQNEPVAEPEPVNEAAELRRRENVPPVAAPDAKPVNPDADLPPEERSAARAARLAGEQPADIPPSQTPIVEEAA
jgi:hypothetical protein